VKLADSLVGDEKVVLEAKKHWMSPVRDSGLAGLLILGAFLLGLISPNGGDGLFGAIGRLLDLIRTGLFLVGVGMIVYNIVVWRTAEFAVTNRRVLREEGLVSRRASSTAIESISDVKSRSGLLGRVLGYGDIEIVTGSGEAGADSFTTITKNVAFQREIMNQKERARSRPGGSGSGAPVAQAAAPMAAAPAPAEADPADTLARLADLRDKGIITPADYEAKKQEVLARI